jgi:hypothetical protein
MNKRISFGKISFILKLKGVCYMGKLLYFLKFDVKTDNAEFNSIFITNTPDQKWKNYQFNLPIMLEDADKTNIPINIKEDIWVNTRYNSLSFHCYFTIDILETIILDPLEHPVYHNNHIYLQELSNTKLKVLFFQNGYRLIVGRDLKSYLEIYNNIVHIDKDSNIIPATMDLLNIVDINIIESVLIDQELHYWFC